MKTSGGAFEVHRLESMAPSMNTGSIETHIVKRACNTEVSHSARNKRLYQMATVFFGWSRYSYSVQARFSKCIVSLTQERSSEKVEIFHSVVGGERSLYRLQLLGSVMNGPSEVLALSLQCQSCGRLLFCSSSRCSVIGWYCSP